MTTLEVRVIPRSSPIPEDMVAELTAATAAESMIGLTREVIDSHEVRFLLLSRGRVAAYGAVTGRCRLIDGNGGVHPMVEIGGDFVAPQFRGNRLAQALLRWRVSYLLTADSQFGVDGAVAFTNPRSRGYFERSGFAPLRTGQSLRDAFELCRRCNVCVRDGLRPWADPAECCDYEGIRVLALTSRRDPPPGRRAPGHGGADAPAPACVLGGCPCTATALTSV